jgi:hypothetical protein
MLQENVLGTKNPWSRIVFEKESDYDVTISVPFTATGGENKEIRVSMRW